MKQFHPLEGWKRISIRHQPVHKFFQRKQSYKIKKSKKEKKKLQKKIQFHKLPCGENISKGLFKKHMVKLTVLVRLI